jgi:hypothetical protein
VCNSIVSRPASKAVKCCLVHMRSYPDPEIIHPSGSYQKVNRKGLGGSRSSEEMETLYLPSWDTVNDESMHPVLPFHLQSMNSNFLSRHLIFGNRISSGWCMLTTCPYFLFSTRAASQTAGLTSRHIVICQNRYKKNMALGGF